MADERLYGFKRDDARILKRQARREGLTSRTGSKVKYPKPLPDDPPMLIGKPTANVTAPNTCTVNLYSGTPGSETATGEQVSGFTYANLTATKFCTVRRINGHYYMGCYQA